jgi:hypothetical protein
VHGRPPHSARYRVACSGAGRPTLANTAAGASCPRCSPPGRGGRPARRWPRSVRIVADAIDIGPELHVALHSSRAHPSRPAHQPASKSVTAWQIKTVAPPKFNGFATIRLSRRGPARPGSSFGHIDGGGLARVPAARCGRPLSIAVSNEATFAARNGPPSSQHFFATNSLHYVAGGFVAKKCCPWCSRVARAKPRKWLGLIPLLTRPLSIRDVFRSIHQPGGSFLATGRRPLPHWDSHAPAPR